MDSLHPLPALGMYLTKTETGKFKRLTSAITRQNICVFYFKLCISDNYAFKIKDYWTAGIVLSLPHYRGMETVQMEDSLGSYNTVVRKQRSSLLNCFNGTQLICLDIVLKLNLHFQLKHVTTTFFLPCSCLTLKRSSRAFTD